MRPIACFSTEGASSRTLRVLLLGTCSLDPLRAGLEANGDNVDHCVIDSYSTSPIPTLPAKNYDTAIVGLTFRHISAEAAQIVVSGERPTTCIYWIRAVEENRLQEYFDACSALLRQHVRKVCSATTPRPIFFLSIVEPMHNYLGNLLPRHNLSNPVYFVRRLNEVLELAVQQEDMAFYWDLNETIGLLGRARIQDDYVAQLSHASFLADDIFDSGRLQASTSPTQTYRSDEQIALLGTALARRLHDDLAILTRPLHTKAIIVDLDDTLWRGVAQDDDRALPEFTEGWPLGLAESLLIYKARGGLLAICSRNEQTRTEKRFNEIFNHRLMLSDFASIKINYCRKSENVAAIMNELNLLPENVIYIDDDPREVDEVRTAFPNIGVYSADHYDWRRKILLSADTQVASISNESRERTRLVQAKRERDGLSKTMSRSDWLLSLELVQRYELVNGIDHPHFARAFELINKTNQFNTTGKRWTVSEFDALFRERGSLLTFFLADRTINNGLVGVFVLRANCILQVVLSCRVFNLEAEFAAGHVVCKFLFSQYNEIIGMLRKTGRNFSCHEFFDRLGYRHLGDGNYACDSLPAHPKHILSDTTSLPCTVGEVLKWTRKMGPRR